MPKAVAEDITYDRPPVVTLPARSRSPMPSPLDLARMARAAGDARDALDRRRVATKDKNIVEGLALDRRMALSLGQQFALQDLAFTLQARTLGDAAAQLVMLDIVLSAIDDQALDPLGMERRIETLRRVHASVVVVVCAAAGISLDEVGDDGLADRCATYFHDEVLA